MKLGVRVHKIKLKNRVVNRTAIIQGSIYNTCRRARSTKQKLLTLMYSSHLCSKQALIKTDLFLKVRAC